MVELFSGIVQIKKEIDYEKIQSLNFTVVAMDTGKPQLNSSAIVLVQVKNINDNDPVFSQKMYNVSINENYPVGSHVLTVRATDGDAEEYGAVTYNLTGEHSENFHINPETGEVTVANSEFLDHETLNETVIQVVASDGAPGSLKRSTSVPIHINILDVNDNAPKFNQSVYNASVIENARLNPPLPILQVHAVDKDVGVHGNINYRIISGNEKGKIYKGKVGVSQTHVLIFHSNKPFSTLSLLEFSRSLSFANTSWSIPLFGKSISHLVASNVKVFWH